jgi:hypothetical protein
VERNWAMVKVENLPKNLEDALRRIWIRGDYAAFHDLQQRYNITSRKVAHSMHQQYNAVVRNAPKSDEPAIEETCCEKLVSDDLPFITYFAEQDPKLKELMVEMESLRIPERIIRMRYSTTTFPLFELPLPIYRNQLGTFLSAKAPESILQNKFYIYCHTGPSTGELHEMESSKYPSITRCVKCDWFLKDLKAKKFTRAEYQKLLDKIEDETLFKIPEPVPWKQKLPLATLKREAHKNIKRDIERLVVRLGRVLKSKKELTESGKKFEKKYTRILKDMSHFSNFFVAPPHTLSDEEAILLKRKREVFAQNKMKNYINDFLRTNISRIRWGFKPRTQDIPWLAPKEEEDLQKRTLQEKEWVMPFIVPANKKLFKKLTFHYSYGEIQDLQGIFPVYDKSWKWITRRSYFTVAESIMVLKYYFVSQLILFLEVSGAGEPVVAEFIVALLEQIEKDRVAPTLSKAQIQKWNDTRREKQTLQRLRYFEAIAEEDTLLFNAPYRQYTQEIWEDPDFAAKYGIDEQATFDKKVTDADRSAFLESQAKEVYGVDASEQQISSFVASKEEEDEVNKEIADEVYHDAPGLKEGEEIMEVGYNYGDEPQNIDNAGDGVNEYTQTNIWDPVADI